MRIASRSGGGPGRAPEGLPQEIARQITGQTPANYSLPSVVCGVGVVVRVVDFHQIPPVGELLRRTCSPLRGELDSSTPRVFGGFWTDFVLTSR